MIKKILIGLVILSAIVGVISVGLMGYGTYKVADEVIKAQEPKLRHYIQLDEAAQNKYILENVDELLAKVDLDKDGKPEDKEKIEILRKLNTQPDIQNALVDLGRSFMATGVMISDPIVKDLSADVKAKYEKESEQLEARLDKYSKLIDAVDPSLLAEE
ncbi:MAG: hypothetical protein II902_01450 [Selenomonadaceae bacterium]|nr:hypothetical protein [Selenomonadaceae bacterium]